MQVYIFSHHGLLCTGFVEHSGETSGKIITELRQRAQKPLLIEERTAYAFRMY